MGACGCKPRISQTRTVFLPGPDMLSYPRNISMKASKVSADGKTTEKVQIDFPVTEPLFSTSKKLVVDGREFWCSACVLPGMDPHMMADKKCQDRCFYETDGVSLFLGLYDGHGSHGHDVADFCVKTATQHYIANKADIGKDPEDFCKANAAKCDQELKLSVNGIDVSGSGTTAVLLLLHNGVVTIGSVGDSRGCLGSFQLPEKLPAVPRPVRGENKDNLDTINSNRALRSDVPLYPVQLTRDQKPEDPEELVRIFKCGGRVARMVDENGNKVGPYRVWKPNTNGPGLAMSRSIGDTVGTDLGVLPDPIFTSYKIDWENDLFMVSASDGVWDVMDNEDVVKFIERYREHAVRDTVNVVTGEPVTVQTSTIAQMLCEEARTRWFSIVEREEVFIDDISCTVTEFRSPTLANPEIISPKENEMSMTKTSMLDPSVSPTKPLANV